MPQLIGRDREIGAVVDALAPEGPGALVLLGDPGIGKSALVAVLVARARERGVRVLSVAGSATESDLPFSGLHRLLLPVIDRVELLPERQSRSLLSAFGLDGGGGAGDRMATCLAALSLLSSLADEGPLLVVVDDAQWIDPATRDVVSFLARRLEGEPVGLLIAARGSTFERGVPTMVLGPLDRGDAERVLDDQPSPPAGALRERILLEAAGNPLALVEFPKAVEREGTLAGELPLTELLERTFAHRVSALSKEVRYALVVAAAEGTGDLAVVHRALGHDNPAVWSQAEETGLVRIVDGRVVFQHPLMRSAVYGSAPVASRERAHGSLAAVLDGDEDRRAWHLAAGATSPDEDVALALTGAAWRALHRGALDGGIRALERAVDMSADPKRIGTWLGSAATIAIVAGQIDRAAELLTRLSDVPLDRAQQGFVAQAASLVALNDMRFDDAFDDALEFASYPFTEENAAAAGCVSVVAQVAYDTGRADQLAKVAAMLPTMTGSRERVWHMLGKEDLPFRLWLFGLSDPNAHGDEARAQLADAIAALPPGPHIAGMIGTLAVYLDEHETAVRLLDEIAGPARDDAPTSGDRVSRKLALACLETGRWNEARLGLDQPAGESRLVAVTSGAIEAVLNALTGETEKAREQARAVLAVAEPAGAAELVVRALWAQGLADLADAEPARAFERLRRVFEVDGAAVHFHVSPYVLGDLAAAAVAAGAGEEVRALLENAVPAAGSVRLAQVVSRARALLADEPEEFFLRALADAGGERWPFERAQVRLDFGEWLRRRRRIAEAREELTAAHGVFARLGARPWADRAAGELRAAGVSVGTAKQDLLTVLTPQQRQIVRLAAAGMTNREIGEQMFLSHRTVGFHLYKSFPLLGVTTRAQLRDVVER
ncbi:AAA family ATPase [Lentzea sp. NPDC058436]|uniref:helix-turn-helix transcriptional regulator n=1 Tax=Lentzea sp. NPDC058436 TaxID=3346499 RepID=UPI003659FB27